VRPRRISDTIARVVDDQGSRRRVPIRADVTFLQPAHATGVTLDADETGMRVLVDCALRPGDRCIAVVQLPDGEETHERATVLWARRSSHGWVAQLEFVA
jgi:hypothetical protein